MNVEAWDTAFRRPPCLCRVNWQYLRDFFQTWLCYSKYASRQTTRPNGGNCSENDKAQSHAFNGIPIHSYSGRDKLDTSRTSLSLPKSELLKTVCISAPHQIRILESFVC